MDLHDLIVSIVALAAFAIAVFGLVRTSNAAGERALAELQLQRDELSKLRFDLTRDRDELREHVGKHEQAIVRMGKDVQAAIVDMKAESSKLSLLHSTPRR